MPQTDCYVSQQAACFSALMGLILFFQFPAAESGRKVSGLARWLIFFVVIVAGLTAGTVARAQSPGLYRIESSKSRIQIHVYRAGLLGDNHLIALERFSGTAESPDGKAWTVHVVAESNSLRVMDPGSSAGTRADIQKTMLGPKQLDVARFPRITLDSQSLEPGPGAGTWRMLSTLTLHGVSRQVDFLIAWQQKGDRLEVRGQKKLRLTDFQIKPIRLAFGALRVKNEFDVSFDLTLEREPQSTAR